mmetsp:Transcript_11789/g.22432  ORF Transcript_11789/g.22432 Transcript_11789/m.22432 type:complete len:239 (-) Transcript_11789:108-824(-)
MQNPIMYNMCNIYAEYHSTSVRNFVTCHNIILHSLAACIFRLPLFKLCELFGKKAVQHLGVDAGRGTWDELLVCAVQISSREHRDFVLVFLEPDVVGGDVAHFERGPGDGVWEELRNLQQRAQLLLEAVAQGALLLAVQDELEGLHRGTRPRVIAGAVVHSVRCVSDRHKPPRRHRFERVPRFRAQGSSFPAPFSRACAQTCVGGKLDTGKAAGVATSGLSEMDEGFHWAAQITSSTS